MKTPSAATEYKPHIVLFKSQTELFHVHSLQQLAKDCQMINATEGNKHN